MHLIRDNDGKLGKLFAAVAEGTEIEILRIPPRSPNLNAFAERWVRSVKSEVLSKLLLFGERALRHALKHYTIHFHQQFPEASEAQLL